MTELYIMSGPERGLSFKLREGDNFVGRSLDNDIRIEDRTVSRKHAKIVMREGRCFITDLRSRNGTFLNGQKLVAQQPRVLRDGDDIRLGHLVLRITFETE